jgi:hypothetical protein
VLRRRSCSGTLFFVIISFMHRVHYQFVFGLGPLRELLNRMIPFQDGMVRVMVERTYDLSRMDLIDLGAPSFHCRINAHLTMNVIQ